MKDTDTDYYALLNLAPGASIEEVRDAYLALKRVFDPNNVALYSLCPAEERDELWNKIEEAASILLSLDSRKVKNHPSSHFLSSSTQVPQNEKSSVVFPSSEEDPLIPPRTDFLEGPKVFSTRCESEGGKEADEPTWSGPDVFRAIDLEEHWSGEFLKRVREAYEISLEEMAGITKISKNYLIAIESDDYSRLPAIVFVRGFVMQIARVLKLPVNKVLAAYLSRFKVD